MEIDYGIFSTFILSFLWIQKEHLSVTGERMCTSTGKLLRGLKYCPEKVWLGKLIDLTLDPNGLTGP